MRTPTEERQPRATSSSARTSGYTSRKEEEEEDREVKQTSVSSMTQAEKEEEEDDWMEQEMKKARYVCYCWLMELWNDHIISMAFRKVAYVEW